MIFNTIRLVSILTIVSIAEYVPTTNAKHPVVSQTTSPAEDEAEIYTTASADETDPTIQSSETTSDLQTNYDLTTQSDIQTTDDSHRKETISDTTDISDDKSSVSETTIGETEMFSTDTTSDTESETTTKPMVKTKKSRIYSTTKSRQKTYHSTESSHQTDSTTEEEDLRLQAAMDVLTHDYEETAEQLNATEAPDMDPLAELVDEHGQKDHGEAGEEKGHDHSSTTTTATTPLVSTIRTTKARFGELRVGPTAKPEPNQNLKLKVKSLINNKVLGIKDWMNMTEVTAKQICMESSQDSGFWCEGSETGKLQIRYFYNPDSKTCDCFLYYGCLGNKNNFQTVKECKDRCEKFGYAKPVKGSKQKTLKFNDCSINP